jgi:hypothetical protein
MLVVCAHLFGGRFDLLAMTKGGHGGLRTGNLWLFCTSFKGRFQGV